MSADAGQFVTANMPRAGRWWQTIGRRERLAVGAVCALLALGIFVAFGRAVTYGLVNWDDYEYVRDNHHVLHGLSVREVVWAFTHSRCGFWLPLVWISYMCDSQLFGPWTGGWHLTNLLLHAATAIGLFLLLFRLTDELLPSALAAGLFAVHPLRVESVVWITERKDVLNGAFFVLTLAAYTAYARRPFSLARYLAVAACYVLSLLAKPMTATLPAVLLLLDYWPLRRYERSAQGAWPTAQRLVLEKLPLFVIAGIFSLVTIAGDARHPPRTAPPSWIARLGGALLSYPIYCWRMVWPANLAPLDPNPHQAPSAGSVGLALAFLVCVTLAALAARRRWPQFLVGWLWYLVMLLPVSGIVSHLATELRPDRFTYLPQIGLAIAFAWGAAEVVRRSVARRLVVVAGLGLLFMALLGASFRQTGFWSNTENVFCRSLAVSPQNPFALCLLADLRLASGCSNEAADLLYRALAVDPHSSEAIKGLGDVSAKLGNSAEALKYYQLAVDEWPGNVAAFDSRAALLCTLNRAAEAIDCYEAALRVEPDQPSLHNNFGEALQQIGQFDRAAEHFEFAVQCNPEQPVGHYNLARCLLNAKRRDEALRHFNEALRLAKQSGPQGLAAAACKQIQRLQGLTP